MYNNEMRQPKRAHSPDFDGPPPRGPHFQGHGGGGFNQHKRHRGDNVVKPITIDEKIANLGDAGFHSNHIAMVAKDIDMELIKRSNDEDTIRNIVAKICKCIVSFPTRVATYATLIGLISGKHYNVSCQILKTLHASYPIYLESQKWQEALTIFYALSSLVSCKVIKPLAWIDQLKLLLQKANEGDIPQARGDYFVYTVLSSLPFVASELVAGSEPQEDQLAENGDSEKPPNSLNEILETIESYLSKRSKSHLNVTRVWQSDDSTIQMDYLESLWVQTRNFRANNWVETFLPKPYYEKEYKDIMASTLIPQDSPTLHIPDHSPEFVYPSPRVVFRVFEDDAAEGQRTIPGSDKIERFCIENHIRNIIDELSSTPKDCVRHLNFMYKSDQLPMKHLLVETILGELFTLPLPRHPPIVYQALMGGLKPFYRGPREVNTYRSNEETRMDFENILNNAVRVLFENLDTMNVTCITRFADWFSYHLNSNEFLFPWASWQDVTTKEEASPKYIFVRNILVNCVRFSFHKKINTIVDSTLPNLMPPATEVRFKPTHEADPRGEELAATIKKMIIDKADMKTISETLNIRLEGIEVPDESFTDEKVQDKLMKLDFFTAVLLILAATKSVTHLSSAIGKFRVVFKAYMSIEGGQEQLLKTIYSCLEDHPQLQVILIDKLLKAGLIEARVVCDSIFSPTLAPHHLEPHPWEILNNTIGRLSNNISSISDEKRRNDEDKQEDAKVLETGTPNADDQDAGTEAGQDVKMETEDVSDQFEQRISQAKSEFQALVLQVFGLFAQLLAEHISKCEAEHASFIDDWFRHITGRMQQVYYNNYDSILDRYDEIRNIVDRVPSIGNVIVNLNQ